MSTKVIATAAVRGINRKLASTRAALTLVINLIKDLQRRFSFGIQIGIIFHSILYLFHVLYFDQTPAAVNRVKLLLIDKPDVVG